MREFGGVRAILHGIPKLRIDPSLIRTDNRVARRKWLAPLGRRDIVGVLYVMPATLLVLVLFVVPLILTGWISLHDWPLIGDSTFSGLANYKYIASDPQFWTSLWFTIRFALVVTPGTVLIGFGLALLVRRALPGIVALRTAYFLPVVVGMSACSYIWYWMFNDRVGIVDAGLKSIGLIREPTEWLADPTTAFIAIAVITIWKSTGFSMVMFMVGLHEIPEEVFEAARVDGAGALQTVWRIALPLLRQTIALVLVLAVIGSFLAFDQFYIMTRGGPQNQTISIVYWIFANGFVYYRLGYGSALAVVLLLILLILSAIQLRAIRHPAET